MDERYQISEGMTPVRRTKYGNQKVETGERTFDSQAEYRRYLILCQLQNEGEIHGLVCQPRYLLQASFSYQGKRYREIAYVGDFQYVERATGATVCEDVKGALAAVFKLKWKLALARYPQIDFRMVQA